MVVRPPKKHASRTKARSGHEHMNTRPARRQSSRYSGRASFSAKGVWRASRSAWQAPWAMTPSTILINSSMLRVVLQD